MPMGCVGVQLWNNQVGEYLSMRLSMSNKGWHSQWFYLKNDAVAPLPEFTGRLIEEAPESWRKWGIPEKDKKIRDHIAAMHILKENGLKGSDVSGAYHARRVVPLMTRALPLYAMAPEASFDGTVQAERVLPNFEITQRIKEAMELLRDDAGAPLDFIYPVRQWSSFVSFTLLMPSLQ